MRFNLYRSSILIPTFLHVHRSNSASVRSGTDNTATFRSDTDVAGKRTSQVPCYEHCNQRENRPSNTHEQREFNTNNANHNHGNYIRS